MSTKGHRRKDCPETIDGQKAEIDAHDTSPSFHNFKGNRDVATEDKYSSQDAHEGHRPGDTMAVGPADYKDEQSLQARKEQAKCHCCQRRCPYSPLATIAQSLSVVYLPLTRQRKPGFLARGRKCRYFKNALVI